MDHFWCALSKDVGRIPETIKHVLEVTEYINAALAYVGNEEIAAIEADIRLLPEIMNKPANDPSLRKYFGRFTHNPARFRLMAGERAVLKMIAGCIQRRGIAHYLKAVERREIRETREKEVVVPVSMDSQANEVRKKIVDFFTERCDGSVGQVDFCNRLSTISVEVSEGEDGGGMLARIRCIFCPNYNDITCRPERSGGGHWKVSNFIAHIRNVHKTLNVPSSAAGWSSKSPGVELSAGESGSNGYGAYEYWSNSNDVSSSYENSFKQRAAQSGGPTMEEFGFVVKEEKILPTE